MKKNIKLFRLENIKDYSENASAAVYEFIKQSIQKNNVARIALSGGNSPKAVYEKLSRADIDWSKVELYMVDERYVPMDHPESNVRMIMDTLMPEVKGVRLFAIPDTKKPIKEAAADYNEMLQKHSRPLFDLVILGLGKDGHTASLFPGIPELDEMSKFFVHTESPAGIKDRLSLTFPAIFSSRKIIFLIRGQSKKKVIDQWLSDVTIRESKLPAKTVLEHEDVEIYYEYGE
jgi:6-phosphogluconolactonase